MKTNLAAYLEPVQHFLDSQVPLKNPPVPQAPLHVMKLKIL